MPVRQHRGQMLHSALSCGSSPWMLSSRHPNNVGAPSSCRQPRKALRRWFDTDVFGLKSLVECVCRVCFEHLQSRLQCNVIDTPPSRVIRTKGGQIFALLRRHVLTCHASHFFSCGHLAHSSFRASRRDKLETVCSVTKFFFDHPMQ